jgi:hypothetical protein
MVLRTWSLALVSASIAVGCHHAYPNSQKVGGRVVARAAMDSAEIERVCAHPDSVHAGLADCVLMDQFRPSQRERPGPPR